MVSCVVCHGPKGEGKPALGAPRIGGMSEWYLDRQLEYFRESVSPAIAGQHDWYIVRQLENYQKGLRGDNPRDTYGVQMAPIVKTLDGRKDFIDLAAYISTL